MLHVLRTTKSIPSNTQPENANAPLAVALTTTGNVYAVTLSPEDSVFYLRADVVDGKVALWLDHGGSEKPFGEPDILEITGPPGLDGVELRIRDFATSAGTYKVSATNDAGTMTGAWLRYTDATESGIKCVLATPSSSLEANWIKFTVSAEPPTGHLAPAALDPLAVIKKEG